MIFLLKTFFILYSWGWCKLERCECSKVVYFGLWCHKTRYDSRLRYVWNWCETGVKGFWDHHGWRCVMVWTWKERPTHLEIGSGSNFKTTKSPSLIWATTVGSTSVSCTGLSMVKINSLTRIGFGWWSALVIWPINHWRSVSLIVSNIWTHQNEIQWE